MTKHAPDLEWMYAPNRSHKQPPLILIPGLMGTRLIDEKTGREVWPGSALGLLFNNYDDIGLSLTGTTEPNRLIPGALTETVAGRDFYGSILRVLEEAAGYKNADDPAIYGRRYYVFTYDWRQDLQHTSVKLDQFIESIRAEYEDQNLKVDLVAHSMGGLIARYFLRFGSADVLTDNELTPTMEGASKVRRVILLGTPNLGSIDAIHALIRGRRVGLRSVPPETLASMPSVFQLFPHALSDWIVTTDAQPLARDQFDVSTWRRFQWSIFDPKIQRRIRQKLGKAWTPEAQRQLERTFEQNLERARRFVWSLTVSTPTPVPLIVFGGDCQYTPARVVVEEVGPDTLVHMRPGEIRHPLPDVNYNRVMLEPGDGTVTKTSLLARMSVDPTVPRHMYTHFPLDYAFLLCQQHEHLAVSPSFQDNLLDALLRPPSIQLKQ